MTISKTTVAKVIIDYSKGRTDILEVVDRISVANKKEKEHFFDILKVVSARKLKKDYIDTLEIISTWYIENVVTRFSKRLITLLRVYDIDSLFDENDHIKVNKYKSYKPRSKIKDIKDQEDNLLDIEEIKNNVLERYLQFQRYIWNADFEWNNLKEYIDTLQSRNDFNLQISKVVSIVENPYSQIYYEYNSSIGYFCLLILFNIIKWHILTDSNKRTWAVIFINLVRKLYRKNDTEILQHFWVQYIFWLAIRIAEFNEVKDGTKKDFIDNLYNELFSSL